MGYVDFLRALHARTPVGYNVEIRKIPGPSRMYRLDDIPEPDDLAVSNYYHSVLPRRASDNTSDVGAIVWADTDGSIDDISTIFPRPSAVIHSGRVNGFHIYWKLNCLTPAEQVTNLSKMATVALKGDFAVCQPRLVFRAPYSGNTKYTPIRIVTPLEERQDLEYDPWDLEERLLASVLAPYYVDGERHEITMALAAVCGRADWPMERTLRVVEVLYDMEPGGDLKGKLQDVRSTYTRIGLGEPVSSAKIKTILDDRFPRLLEALGISARNGDLIVEGETIGKVSNIERDVTNYFLARGDWASSGGRLVYWRGTHWAPADDGILTAEIFRTLSTAQYNENGDLLELPATAKTARAVTSVLTGRLHQDPMPAAEEYHLPLSNGTLDLRSLTIEPTTKEHRHTWVVPLAYDPAVQCPDWIRFIEEAAPTSVLQDHLQEWMGYTLMAGNRWQRMLWLYGPSGTGKSTYIKTARLLLGPASVAVSTEKFSDYTIAQLDGMRLGVCSELSPKLLRTSVVKSLVAGDAVQARHPYGRPFSVTFTGKLIWGSNELPVLDQGEGMWRRIVPVEFSVKPKVIDGSLDFKLLMQASGILNWAITGLRRLIIEENHGGTWTLPDSVTETIKTYREASDPMRAFADEEIDYSDSAGLVPVLEVYTRYAAWAKERGLYVRSLDPVFFQEVRKIGLEPERQTKNGRTIVLLKGGTLRPGIFAGGNY